MMKSTIVFFGCLALCGAGAAGESLPPIRAAAVPRNDATPVRRAHRQPTVPDNYKEIPFEETAPAPSLTAAEKQRGYLLFQRPLMDPVYPNTHPLPHERLRALTAFATPGEFEPVTFSLYPVRPLTNLRVRASALNSPAGRIPAADLDVRLLTYWNIGFPRYTSRDTYRRVPELLERVTVHSSPAQECQRWWITVHVPEKAKPGLYQGTVTVWDDGWNKATAIPLALRVLPFRLKADPAKHYSAYYQVRNRVIFQGKDEDFIRRATANEYRAMVELGLDMCPTFYLRYDAAKKKLYVVDEEELGRILKAGLKGPVPLAGGIGGLFREMAPGVKVGSHWRIDREPPPAFYRRVTEAFRAFKQEWDRKGWPEVICCPLDEVAASRKEFGSRVFKAVHDAGVRTYITKNPLAADAAAYRDGVDVWCSQPYSMPYEKIIAQKRYEYWSYPNHNAGEIKDRRVMCKGGRMTYGFGFWRSGYTTLIPWHWAWTPRPDQFDYLRGRRSGCGQRIDDQGQVIRAVYWECFREGRDDERYLYTLQQAVWEREPARQPACRKLVAQAKTLLQSMWDDINVQQKYLADGMWPSEEFNARRWKLAQTIQALLRYPAARSGAAPSVLVAGTTAPPRDADSDFLARAEKQGLLETKDLEDDPSQWVNVTSEGKLSFTRDAGRNGRKGLRWQVRVDHKVDGGEGGKYPVGWPRIYRSFTKNPLDMARYDYLLFLVRVDSDRDEVNDDSTPVGVTLHSNHFFETSRDLGDRQRVWIPLLFPIRSLISQVGQGEKPWKSIERVQFFISERNYTDGTKLTFDLGEVKLLRFTSPVIRSVTAPRYVLLPRQRLPVSVDLMGARSLTPGAYTLTAAMVDAQGREKAKLSQDLTAGPTLVLDASRLAPALYTLRVSLAAADGKQCSRAERTVECLAGPIM